MFSVLHLLVLATQPLYRDASQPVNVRVADLLSKMNLEEKVAQLLNPFSSGKYVTPFCERKGCNGVSRLCSMQRTRKLFPGRDQVFTRGVTFSLPSKPLPSSYPTVQRIQLFPISRAELVVLGVQDWQATTDGSAMSGRRKTGCKSPSSTALATAFQFLFTLKV